jgi:methionyl-tRNA formyltransferase
MVVTQDDPFYMPLFFESLFSSLNDDIRVVEVSILPSFDESFIDSFLRMFRFYGPTNFVRKGIKYSYRKVVDFFDGGYSVKSIARSHDVSVTYRNSVNTSSFLSSLQHNDVDVVLSASAPEIFDTQILEAPSWGCINVHTADLPKYRGMMPTFWALYHGEDTIGVTIHTMAEAIDRGEIVRQTNFPVETKSLDDAIKQGKRTGGQLAAEALQEINRGQVELKPMEGEDSYFSFPSVNDRKKFQRKGGRLL